MPDASVGVLEDREGEMSFFVTGDCVASCQLECVLDSHT